MILGAGAVAGGIVLGLQADGMEDDLRADSEMGLLARNDSRFRRGKTFAALANASWGLAGLMGLLSLYYFIRDPLPDSSADVLEPRDWTFTPILSPSMRAGGAQLDWRF